MIFCDRKDCEFNDDGACENPGNITLDDTGTCTDYVYDDPWEYMDDIEREEAMRIYAESEADGE